MEQLEKQVFTVPEVAYMLGISKSYAYEMVKCKVIPVLEIGTRKVVPKRQFEEWLAGEKESQ